MGGDRHRRRLEELGGAGGIELLIRLVAVLEAERLRTLLPMDEFNRVLGGGLVPGSVVLIGSVSGWKPGPPAQYGVAKSALIQLEEERSPSEMLL